MARKDYYQILGVSQTASAQEIKVAYRRLARQYHPDVNRHDPLAEAKFKEVNEAYEVLHSPEKRAEYDRTARQTNYAHRHYYQPDYPIEDEFEDLFGRVYRSSGRTGSRQNRRQSRRGRDIKYPVTLTMTEAYYGAIRTYIKDGYERGVQIPPGVDTGVMVRLLGQGSPGVGYGPDGDAYFIVTVLPDDRFERKGNDLYSTLTVDLYTAVLGGDVEVPTIPGSVTLKVPSGSQNGQTFRLRDQGMPDLDKPNQYGSLYVKIEVHLPTRLSKKQRALFNQLRRFAQE